MDSLAFVIHEVEQLVPSDRPTNAASELIETQRRFLLRSGRKRSAHPACRFAETRTASHASVLPPDLMAALMMVVARPYSAEKAFCMTLNSWMASIDRFESIATFALDAGFHPFDQKTVLRGSPSHAQEIRPSALSVSRW